MAVARKKIQKFVLVQPKNGAPFTRLQEVNANQDPVNRGSLRSVPSIAPARRSESHAFKMVEVQENLESVALGNSMKPIANRAVLLDQFADMVQYGNDNGDGTLVLREEASRNRDRFRELHWTVEIGMDEGIIDHAAYANLITLARDYDEYRPFRPTSKDLKMELEFGRPNGREIILSAEKAGAKIELQDKIGFIDMDGTGLEIKDLYTAALHCRAFGR